MKSKKLLAILLAGLISASAFAGCTAPASTDGDASSKEPEAPNMDGDVQLNEPGEFPIVIGDKITISAFTAPHTDENTILDSETNAFSKWFEDKTNIKIDWSIVTKADKAAKLNLLFQSDNYEDIIFGTGWNGATQYSYGEQGYLIPLNDYLENDAFYYDKFMEASIADGSEHKEYWDMAFVMPDGNIYSMGQATGGGHNNVAFRMRIYQPWLDAVGMDMPETTDEYYEALKAFKTQDPNGNNQADEIPLTGSLTGWNTNPFDFLTNSFLYYNAQDKTFVEDGDVEFVYTRDEMKEAIKYFHKLSSEGLLSEDTFVQEPNSLKALTTQDVQKVGSVAGGNFTAFTVSTNNEEGDWTNWALVNPLKGPDGVQYARYTPPYPQTKLHITNNCKTPRAAFRMIDALYEEEVSANCVLGMQDDYWRYLTPEDNVEGELPGLATFQQIRQPTDGGSNYTWNQIGVSSIWRTWKWGLSGPDRTLNHGALFYEARDAYWPFIPSDDELVPPLIFTDNDSKTVVDIKNNLDTTFEQKFADFVINGQIDERWDAYVAEMEAKGLPTLEKLYQAAYEERMKQFD